MLRRPLLRAARLQPTAGSPLRLPHFRRPFATGNEGPHLKPKSASRILQLIDRWQGRLPRFMQKPLIALRGSPTSYIVSFALLHEITAIVPLFGLVGIFHYYQWLPSWFAEGEWIVTSVEKLGRWFKRRGWIDAEDEAEVERQTKAGMAAKFEQQRGKMSKAWNKSEKASRWLVEFATAYAIVKFLIPARLVLSAFWAPGFAKWVVLPVSGAVRNRLVRIRAWFTAG